MTKVRVLYPSAFVTEVEGGAVVSVDDALAKDLIAAGYAEPVKAEPAAKKTETAVVKLKDES